MAEGLGFRSVGTVQRYKVRLEQLGLLQVSNNGRGLELIEQEAVVEAVELPLLGRVAAGMPIERFEYDEFIEVPKSMVAVGAPHFVLLVEGQSMIEDCIMDGDKVVIHQQAHATNGQIVVALIDNEATIKRYYKKRGRVELHPANPDYDIIQVDPASEFTIAGVLKGVIRHVD